MNKFERPSNLTQVVVLFCICFVSVNNFFSYHEPSAIANEYQSNYKLTTQEFGTLFTIYSLPNVILVYFSGLMIDKIGIRYSSLFFGFLVFLGGVICALTPFPSNKISTSTVYFLLLFGRFLLGLGGESIFACSSTMIGKWFTNSNHLNTAVSMNQAIVQVFGSSAVFYILPHIHSISISQWVTVAVCLVSLASNLIYNYFDWKYDGYLDQLNASDDANEPLNHKSEDVTQLHSLEIDHPSYQQNYSGVDADHNTDIVDLRSIDEDGFLQVCAAQIGNVFRSYPSLFWFLLLHITLLSPILYTFTAFGPLYLEETFPSTRDPETAGYAISLLYIAIGAAPLSGMFIDMVGHRLLVQFTASCGIPLLFIFLTFGTVDPKTCMFLMGILFSFTESNGLALISILVPTQKLGSAYGLLGCCISFALLLEPAYVGYLRESTGSFSSSVWMFTVLSGLGASCALALVLQAYIINPHRQSGDL